MVGEAGREEALGDGEGEGRGQGLGGEEWVGGGWSEFCLCGEQGAVRWESEEEGEEDVIRVEVYA